MTSRVPSRAPYEGLLQIFNYNRPFYLRTVAGIIAAIILSVWLPPALRTILLLATGTATFWTCSSLLVSHYIYDRSGLYRLCWLHECLSQPPMRWINIHSGIDEISLAIAAMFPGSDGQITDIYDPRELTEPSIKRAHRLPAVSSASADRQVLPARDQEFEAAFLMFAAHELRHHEARVRLFREVARVLRIGGEVVLVEHLRNWVNFLCVRPRLPSLLLGTHMEKCGNGSRPVDTAAPYGDAIHSRIRLPKAVMNVYLHLKVAGALLLALGLAHSLFGRYFKWEKELAQLSLLTRQIFLVHCFFISLVVVLIGPCSLFYTNALFGSGTLSRVVLTGFVVFWSIRLACQFFVYDSAIWRGRRFYTAMHFAFSIFWIYVVLIYGAALRLAWNG
jgi:Methyltransferase domain